MKKAITFIGLDAREFFTLNKQLSTGHENNYPIDVCFGRTVALKASQSINRFDING